ncbi:MAG: SMI1/KNR4 family protein [Gemmatimonadota bacterium]|nr:SMI1/KNR4 family protein [Gemmatimonadota bacterium]
MGVIDISARVRAYYEAIGAAPRPGVAPGELAAFEAAHGLTLPRPVSEFYFALDGLGGVVPELGFHALQLWSLAELSRVSEQVAEFRGIPDYGPIVQTLRDADQYFAFGDGAIWSHVLAFRLTPHAGPVLWICGDSYAEVAPSFNEFWDRYLDDPDSMLWPTEEQVISPAG